MHTYSNLDNYPRLLMIFKYGASDKYDPRHIAINKPKNELLTKELQRIKAKTRIMRVGIKKISQ